MENLLKHLQVKVDEAFFLKDPETSDVGKKMIQQGILLMEEIGIEEFTFKKLSEKIKSPESTIYRYFTNKYQFLAYLCSWYWSWLDYKLAFSLANLNLSSKKIDILFEVLSDKPELINQYKYISGASLLKVVQQEASKILHYHSMDLKHKLAYNKGFKIVCGRIEKVIHEINPSFKNPKALTLVLIEGYYQHQSLLRKNETLTDIKNKEELERFWKILFLNSLSKK